MFKYLKFGNVAPMHHTAHYVDGRLLNEYCFTREGFEEPYSILYLFHPPTGESEQEVYREASWGEPQKRKSAVLQRRHFRSKRMNPQGHFISGRVLLAFNDDLTYGLCHPEQTETAFFANNDADELFFLAEGNIKFQSLFGRMTLTVGIT